MHTVKEPPPPGHRIMSDTTRRLVAVNLGFQVLFLFLHESPIIKSVNMIVVTVGMQNFTGRSRDKPFAPPPPPGHSPHALIAD